MPTLSSFDLLQAQFLVLKGRVDRLESMERLRSKNGKDAAEAELAASKLGLDPVVFVDSTKILERRDLARSLHVKGWTPARISKVMGCCEKTAARWVGAWGE